MNKIIDIIRQKTKEYGGAVKREEVINEVETNFGIDRTSIETIIENLRRDGIIYEPKPGYLMLT